MNRSDSASALYVHLELLLEPFSVLIVVSRVYVVGQRD